MVSAANRRVLLPIEGMTCDHCRRRVEEVLRQIPGVAAVSVDLAAAIATLELSAELDSATLAAAVEEAGYRVGDAPREKPNPAHPQLVPLGILPAAETPRTTTSLPDATDSQRSVPDSTTTQRFIFLLRGLHCASCVQNVEQALLRTDGVAWARVNLPLQQAVVAAKPEVQPATLIAAITAAGYGAEAVSDDAPQQALQLQREETNFWQTRFWFALVCLLPVMIANGLSLGHSLSPVVTLSLATSVQLFVGGPYLLGAWQQLRHRHANMDSLVALGTTTAFLAGLVNPHADFGWMESMMILTFITLGKYLEALSKRTAARGLWQLLDLTPPTARVISPRGTQTLPVGMVTAGEQILIAPGERIPLDARIATGTSDIDEAWLTGESLPIAKTVGSSLFAGTINLTGSLTAVVTQPADRTALAQAIRLLREAQESKGKYQLLADRVVAWFVPGVLLIALVTLALWSFFTTAGWQQGLECAVAVLVVACPCALGLAMPTALLVATGRGAELGIFIKSSQALEAAEQVTHVFLDKTGTITQGKPVVREIIPREGVTKRELLTWGAAAEQGSNHPFAQAILQAAAAEGISLGRPGTLRVLPGIGLLAATELGEIGLGNRQLLHESEVELATLLPAYQVDASPAGTSILFLTRDGHLQGAFVVADAISPSSSAAIANLEQQQLQIAMLSGDQAATAKAIAEQVGIAAEHVHAGLSPAGKLELIQKTQRTGAKVAMIGDGINDAPALAAADLGIAIGNGSAVAIESADIVLLRSDLTAVAQALRLSRQTMRVIRQNLAWAWGYNLILIPLAAGVFLPWFGWRLPPIAAAAAMAASSVTVVLNSVRLRSMFLQEEKSLRAKQQERE